MVKKIIDIILSSVLCLLTLVSGAHAYLRSNSQIQNTFLVGDVDVTLVNNNSEILLGPGESASYSVEAKNSGQINSYVYMIVEDPLYSSGDTFSTKDLNVTLYALQEKYKHLENSDDVWAAYFDPAAVLGEEKTDNNKTPVFNLLYDSSEGFNNSKWSLMGTYQTETSYYYLCKYSVGILKPGESTGVLFDQIQVNETIGDPTGYTITKYSFFPDYYTVSDYAEVNNAGGLSCFDVWDFGGEDCYTPESITYMGKIDDVLCLVSVDDDGNISKYPGVSAEYYLMNYLCEGEDEELVDNEVDTSEALYLAMIDKSGNVILNDDGTPDEYYYLGVQWEGKIFSAGTVSSDEIDNIGVNTVMYINNDITASEMTQNYISDFPELYDLLDSSTADETHVLSDGSDIELNNNIIYYNFVY